LFGLWSPPPFRSIVDYDSWETELLEDKDILRHIAAGVFVPITIGGDGAFQFLARVGSPSAPAELTDRGRAFRVVTSAPYLFIANDGAVVTGIEHVGADTKPGLHVPMAPGRWQVTVSLIDWTAEPRQQEGRPKFEQIAQQEPVATEPSDGTVHLIGQGGAVAA
jgi:hypothetical protein